MRRSRLRLRPHMHRVRWVIVFALVCVVVLLWFLMRLPVAMDRLPDQPVDRPAAPVL